MDELEKIVLLIKDQSISTPTIKEILIELIDSQNFSFPLLNISQNLLIKKYLKGKLNRKKLHFSGTERRRMAELKAKLTNIINKQVEILKQAKIASAILELITFSRYKEEKTEDLDDKLLQ